MPLRIFNNINSLVAQTRLGFNNSRLGETFQRIASGERVLKGADDAASLSISTALKSDSRTLRQAARNLNDGLAMVNVAEGALSEQASILIRMRELASQSATGTIGRTDRQSINLEFSSQRSELDRIGATTEFNGIKILDGTLASNSSQNVEIHVGLNSKEDNRINLNQDLDLDTVNSSTLGIAGLSTLDPEVSIQAMDALEAALDEISLFRARVGATQNRLVRTLSNINVSIENYEAANSTLKDADLAVEFAELTKQQLLINSASAMVGQSNLQPQGVLQLLQ